MNASSNDILDVAVVGGGVAGTYSAWRLLSDRGAGDRPLKLALFEGGDRIGGRLLSVRPPGMEKLVCELGGMFFSSLHVRVCAVANQLGLPVQEIPHCMPDTFYLRRRRFHQVFSTLPYNFNAREQDVSPDQLLNWALEKVIPGITKLTGPALDEALARATVEGIPVADWGFWNLLCLTLSSEAFAYVHDTTPDDYLLINSNAADAIRALQCFSSPTSKVFRIRDGYAELPRTLCQRAEKAGAAIHMQHRLLRIARAEGGLVRLDLARGSDGWGPTAKGEPISILARQVILAMPKRSLELIERSGPVFGDEATQAMIHSVTSIPMFKMFSCYTKPWWKEFGFGPNGIAVTDLPLKACLYWGTEGDQPGADPSNQNSLLLTSLEDMTTTTFWTGLRDPHRGPVFAPRMNLLRAGPAGDSTWGRYADCTADRLVREAQRQLSEVHGIDVPEPYAAASKDWTVDPFGGAMSEWNIGARSAAIMDKMTKPVDGFPVYVCGESYSRSQGWVEGALETAELMLKKHFGSREPT